jgi:hypothetical protein
MKTTVKDVEAQIEGRSLDFLHDLGLIPEGYRCRARLHGKSRDKRRTAEFERNWSPDTDSIIIEFERNPDPPQKTRRAHDSPPRFPRLAAEDSQPSQHGSQPLAHAPLAPPAGQARKSSAVDADPQSDLVRALNRAESRPGYSFVALKWFRDSALTSEGFTWAAVDSERQAVLRSAIDKRLILTSKVPNPKSPQFPVTAIRLNRLMPEVKAILETPGNALPDFKPMPIRGGDLSATVLRDRR